MEDQDKFLHEYNSKPCIKHQGTIWLLGTYNHDIGVTPFERFFLGGDGLSGYNNLDGRELIGMRGYSNESITPNYYLKDNVGGVIYSKYTFEVRYPFSLNPNATIYALSFLEAGNSWESFAAF